MPSKRLHVFIPPGPTREQESVYPAVIPRGALIVAGRARREGWTSTVFDAYSFPSVTDEFEQQASVGPAVIGLSIHGAPSVPPARRVLDGIRRRRPDTRVIVGGNLANVATDLMHGAFGDALIYGGGADLAGRALAHLLDIEECGVFPAPNPDTSWDIPDLDSLYIPFDRYLDDPNFEYHLPTQVGCPFRCFHCGTGRPGLIARTNLRPAESLAEELDWLMALCDHQGRPYPHVWITDETFTSAEDHVMAICDVFARRPQLQWRAQTRVDCVESRLLRAMKDAGCDTIAFGVEVPTDPGLALFGKREVMGRAEYAFHVARDADLRTQAILVFGAPDDTSTFADVFETLGDLRPHSLQTYLYHPVPGSPWWRTHGRAFDLAVAEQWGGLDFHSPPLPKLSTDAMGAVDRFLASIVWTACAEKTEAVLQWRSRLLGGYPCPRCASMIQGYLFQTHDTVDIIRIACDSNVVLVALGSSELVAYALSQSRKNIYSSLMWVLDSTHDVAASLFCGRCGETALAAARMHMGDNDCREIAKP